MAIYAAIFPPGDGEYEERPRDPYARGRQHKEPPQFTWEWFPVHILFCLSRLFSTFRFSFFHPSSLFLSVSLQSSTLTLTLRSFPTLALVFTPTPFTPELLPLMNRGGITRCTRGANGAAASAGWKDRESGGTRGKRRRRDSKPSRRYLRAYNEEGRGFIRGDSFSNFCPALILLFLVVSRLDVARKKKVLKAATKYDALRFKLW